MRTSPTRFAARTCLLAAMAALVVGFLTGPLPAGASPSPLPTLDSPIEPFLALRLFDRPDTPWGSGHRGIDVMTGVGQDVLAPGAGVVSFAGPVADRGVVSVDHGDGWVSSVEPVLASVSVGDPVREGTPIGTVTDEPGHCEPRTCLHWGVRHDGRYVNPLDVLRGFGPIRLLPLPRSA